MSGAKDVAALVEALNINASNPAVVLTQDMTRSFAGSASERAKYQVRGLRGSFGPRA